MFLRNINNYNFYYKNIASKQPHWVSFDTLMHLRVNSSDNKVSDVRAEPKRLRKNCKNKEREIHFVLEAIK